MYNSSAWTPGALVAACRRQISFNSFNIALLQCTNKNHPTNTIFVEFKLITTILIYHIVRYTYTSLVIASYIHCTFVHTIYLSIHGWPAAAREFQHGRSRLIQRFNLHRPIFKPPNPHCPPMLPWQDIQYNAFPSNNTSSCIIQEQRPLIYTRIRTRSGSLGTSRTTHRLYRRRRWAATTHFWAEMGLIEDDFADRNLHVHHPIAPVGGKESSIFICVPSNVAR